MSSRRGTLGHVDRRVHGRLYKTVCRVCGRSRDEAHDNDRCSAEWIRRCEAEALKAKEEAR